MRLKEHSIKRTAVEIKRSIARLEEYASLNPDAPDSEAAAKVAYMLKEAYDAVPEEHKA